MDQKTHLVISNLGVIEEEALNLIGASSKRDDDSKIGYFGSGLKYALAYLLRNNIEIRLFSDGKEIQIDTVPEVFRKETYHVIRINRKKTSFTTTMGPDWELWFAIREIYANALDEGDAEIKIGSISPSLKNHTDFYIKLDGEVNSIMKNFDAYFSTNRTPVIEIATSAYGNVKLYHPYTSKVSIYRKGIRCYDADKKSIYDYDIEDIDINESRVLKYSWESREVIRYLYPKCTDVDILRNFFGACINKEYIEFGISWVSNRNFSDAWLEAIAGRILIPYEMQGWYVEYENKLVLPGSLVLALSTFFKDKVKIPASLSLGGDIGFREVELNNMQNFMWQNIMDFCKECKIDVPYGIKFVEYENNNQMGHTIINGTDKQIYIGLNAFIRGKSFVLETLIEEIVHAQSGKADKTREFQDALVRYYLNYVQMINTKLI